MVHFRREKFPAESYGKLGRQKFGPFRILKKLGTNAFLVDLPNNVPTSPIFNVTDLFLFHGEFSNPVEVATLPFAGVRRFNDEYTEEVVDIKLQRHVVESARGIWFAGELDH